MGVFPDPQLVDTAPQPDQVTFDPDVQAPLIPAPDVANTRAYKAHYGIGDVVKQSYDEIYQKIANGQEDALRKQAATALDYANIQSKQKTIADMAAAQGSSLTLDQVNAVLNPANPSNRPNNPDTVIEQGYAHAYMGTLPSAAAKMEDTPLDNADPQAVAAYLANGTDLISKREIALKKAQDLQPDVDNDAYFHIPTPIGGIAVGSKSAPVRSTANILTLGAVGAIADDLSLRGNTDNTGRLAGLGLGENLDLQAKELLDLPIDQFNQKFTDITNTLYKIRPDLAQQFATAVAGMSTSDKIIDNANTLLNVTMAGSLASAAKAGLRAVGDATVRGLGNRPRPPGPQSPEGLSAPGTIDATQGADGVYRTAGPSPEAAQAVKDMVQSANTAEVTKASIAEGAGDTAEAGVQKATASTITPNPIKDSVDTLPRFFRSDIEAQRNDPGSLTREEHTRLLDAGESFMKDVISTAKDVTKVQRTPLAIEDGFRNIQPMIAQYYPGRENTILDTNIRYEPETNTYWADTKIGNYDATQFTSTQAALNHAQMNGYGQPTIVSEGTAGRYYIPEAAVKRPWESGTRLGSVEVKDGIPRVLTDDGAEVQLSTTPQVGHIPLDVSGTDVKFGKTLNEETVKVAQQGLGFHLVVSKPLNEIDNYFRSGLIGNESARSSSNKLVTNKVTAWANAITGPLRNPNDTLSQIETRNRLKVAYSQSKFAELAVQQMEYINDIAKGKIKTDEFGDPTNWIVNKSSAYLGKATGVNARVWEEFVRTLDASRKLPAQDTGLPGYFFKGSSELEDFYLHNFQRMPSFAETKGYFAFTRLYTYDLYMREISQFKNKARLGTETHVLKGGYTPKGSNSGEAINITLPPFEGVMHKSLPRTEDAMLIHNSDGTIKVVSADSVNTNLSERLSEGIKTGKQKVIEIYDPESRPLGIVDDKGFPARIRYVVSNAVETTPLSHAQIGRRGGGHFEWDYEHYLKQPIIRRQWIGNKLQHIYEGDATLAPVDNISMGKDLASKFNLVRQAIKEGRMKDAKALVEAHSDAKWKEVRSWFFAQKELDPVTKQATGKMVPARFNLEHDFQVVPKGTTINELDKTLYNKFDKKLPNGDIINSFQDGTRHGSLARNFQVEYTGKRDSYDLFTFKNVGNVDNPVYKYEPAQFTDPIVTMTRALNRIVNSTYMDDYKIMAVEHWIEENKDLLKATDKELRASPFAHFNEITWNSFKKGDGAVDTARKINAMSNWYKAKKLMGTPSAIDLRLHGIKQTLSDSMYSSPKMQALVRAGDKVEAATGSKVVGNVIRAPTIVPEWMVDNVKSPVDFFRSMAFHSIMGLWNVPQLLVQQTNWATIVALSPGHVMQSGFATLMHQWSRLNRNKEITEAMDHMATKFGWRPGDLTEARRVLDNSGFESVGAEHTLRQGHAKDEYIRYGIGSDIKKITLDWGQKPFLEGERNVRLGAWYAAFHEFRTANPFGKIGPIEEGKILERADNLYGNMSRASNSAMNAGPVGIMTQFWAYQYRLTELFIGGRTSWADKATMALVYGALYGTGALALTGVPFGDFMRKWAIANGYVVGGNNDLASLAYEGGLAYAAAKATGNWYNFANKYGPSGIPMLKDMAKSDTTIWKILGGAAGSKLGQIWESTDGFTNAMYSMLKGETGKEAWPMTLQDWTDPIKAGINSMGALDRLVYAIEYGKWINKHEQTGANVGIASALWMTLSGTDLQSMNDQFVKRETMKDEDERWKKARGQFAEERHRAEDAATNNDTEAANEHNRKAFAYLTQAGIPKERWGAAIAFAAKGWESTIEANDARYYQKFVPDYRKDTAQKAYHEQLNLK